MVRRSPTNGFPLPIGCKASLQDSRFYILIDQNLTFVHLFCVCQQSCFLNLNQSIFWKYPTSSQRPNLRPTSLRCPTCKMSCVRNYLFGKLHFPVWIQISDGRPHWVGWVGWGCQWQCASQVLTVPTKQWTLCSALSEWKVTSRRELYRAVPTLCLWLPWLENRVQSK